MATDATGTPTSLGIPTFNVDVDAPSGLGSNAQMASIDTLIAARVTKPTGIVSGEAVVWNGTGWDRSSVTRVGATSLGSGTPDSTKFLRGDSSWQVVASGPTWTINATPPGSPNNGDLWVFPADDANGVYWTFIFDSAETTYKWRFLGGPPMVSQVDTLETSTSSTYGALATAGPSIALTRDGDYMVSHGFVVGSGGTGEQALMSYDVGATAAIDADAVRGQQNPQLMNLSRVRRKTAIGASKTLTAKYRLSSTASLGFQDRWMNVTPVRVI